MAIGKNLIKQKKIMQPLSEFVTGLPSESILLITLNDSKLNVVTGENLSPEGAWALSRFAMIEIKNSLKSKSEANNGNKK